MWREFNFHLKKKVTKWDIVKAQVYKLVFMLNSTEHEVIFPLLIEIKNSEKKTVPKHKDVVLSC